VRHLPVACGLTNKTVTSGILDLYFDARDASFDVGSFLLSGARSLPTFAAVRKSVLLVNVANHNK
jgi:hypothetical protein